MTLTDIPNHKQNNIARWLWFEISSQNLTYKIFLEYNDNYPLKIDRIVKI